MAWTQILFEDEPFEKDFPPDRFKGFSRNEVMSLEKAMRELVPEQVKEIKRRALAREKYADIAQEFSISPQQVYQISVGKSWKHLFNEE